MVSAGDRSRSMLGDLGGPIRGPPSSQGCGFFQMGLPRLTWLGVVDAPARAPAPPPMMAPAATPTGPPTRPTVAPVAAPAAAPPCTRPGSLVPQPASRSAANIAAAAENWGVERDGAGMGMFLTIGGRCRGRIQRDRSTSQRRWVLSSANGMKHAPGDEEPSLRWPLRLRKDRNIPTASGIPPARSGPGQCGTPYLPKLPVASARH